MSESIKHEEEMVAAALEAFERLNQSEPEPRPYRNPVEDVELITMSSSIDAHCCKTPFEELKPVKLREMEVPKIHRGRYLVCKVKEEPFNNIGTYTTITDLNGDIEGASFYNFCYDLLNVQWIVVGTIFIVKEPRLQYSHSKTAFLRIDSPSDVIFVDPTDETFLDKIGAKQWYDESASKDAEVWRQKANECFKNGKYEKALFLYDRGIRCNPDLAVLYLNKALTCLKIGAFYDAYESAKLGLEKGGYREKALYRMGQAAYGMREWEKAAKHFCEVLKEFPQNSDAPMEFKRATDRLKEQRTGKFDFKSMFLESKNEKPEIDVADYTGPIEVANIPGKGRGIIASKDIQKGTLLVVSKSIGSGYSKDYPRFKNLVDDNPRKNAQLLQVIGTVQYLKNNPQKKKEIYDLYAGDNLNNEEIPNDVLDVARLEKISSFNRFESDKGDSAHLFILPSYFNHSCLANAYRDFYDDVMVIHACADMKKGAEICHTYIDPLGEFSVRKMKFDEWKFTCKCKLCEIDSKDEFCAKRYQLLQEFLYIHNHLTCLEDDFKRCEKLIRKVRETYTKRSEFKTVLAQMLVTYDLAFTVHPLKYFEYLEELTTLVDDSLDRAIDMPHVYDIFEGFYRGFKNHVKAEEMKQKAIETSFCTDFEHFKMVYPEKKP